MRVTLNKLIKIISFTIAVILAVSIILPVTITKAAEIASGTCGENLTWTLDSDGTLTISGEGEMEGDPWNSYREDIYSAIVEYGALSISNYAFYGCTNLESITIPNSVTIIGDHAFDECRNLENITIPESVTSIGKYTFWRCSMLTSIAIPNSVTIIGDHAFDDCRNLESVTISKSVTNISNTAFFGCSSMSEISVDPENGVYDSRDNCNAIIETETNTLMLGCSNTIIPEDTESIGNNAFCSCYNLTNIEIPDSVTSIGNEAFRDCRSLETITIPQGVTSIGEAAFYNCRSLGSIDIPESLSEIGNSVFQSCISFKSITIPQNVTSIAKSSFANCYNVETIIVDPGNPVYDSRDNCNAIIETETNYLLRGCNNTIIPNTTAVIGHLAFSGCGELEGIIIPESVTSIEDFAFYYCSGLVNITIPDSVTSFGRDAFAFCSELEEITIPEGTINLPNEMFFGCKSLSEVYLPDSLQYITNQVFYGCTSLSSIVIPQKVKSIGSKTFANCAGLEKIIVDPLNEVYDSRDNCNAIIETETNKLIAGCYSSVIPDTVAEIGSYAFSHCFNLRSISIPEGVHSIGYYSFENCSSLNEIVFPSTLRSIDEGAFRNCGVINVVIPGNVEDIGDSAFRECPILKNVYISDGVASMGSSAFGGNNLNSISIPQSAINFGYYPLDCKIQELFYGGSEAEWQELDIDTGMNTDIAMLFTREDHQESLLPDISIAEVSGGIVVTIESAGSEIFYTLDGSIPCTASIPYEGSFIIDEPGEYFINARAFNLDEGQCSPVSTEYIYLEQSERPEIHERNGQVMITGEGDIYYSLDVTEDPTTDSYRYTAPLSFSETTVIKARCIEDGKAASEIAGYTYYAGSSEGITFPEESYSFENTKQTFGYTGFAYRIPEERYTEIFGSAVGEFLYDEYGTNAWGGSCFGMSATSILFHKGMLSLGDYSDEAGSVYELLAPRSADSMLTQLIERYQISQFLPAVMEERGDVSDGGTMVISGISGNSSEGDSLLDAIRSGLNGGDPVILIVWRQDLAGSHAVVPYKVEDGKIYVYDCNRPGTERYITYRTNDNGTYSFSFGEYSYAVSYNRFSTLMNGLESNVDIGTAVLSSEEEERMLISIDSTDVTILDMNGNEVDLINYRATEDIETDNTVVCLGAGAYRINNNDSSRKSFSVSAVTDDDYQKATVNDPKAVIEVRERNGKVYFCITSEAETDIEASTLSSKGFRNSLSLSSDYAELYSTTDRNVIIRAKASTATINGEEQELFNDGSDPENYYGTAVSPDAEAGARLYREGEQYTLSTDITSLPGEAFNLTAFATGGNDDTILYAAGYSNTGQMIALKGVRMTTGKTRYPFSVSKNAVEVKVFMVSVDKYIPLINNMVIK